MNEDCVYRIMGVSGQEGKARPQGRALPAVPRRPRRSGRSPAWPYPPGRPRDDTRSNRL